MTEQELMAEIEIAIDRVGLSVVLQSIAEICSEKADHVMETYADKGIASNWRNVATIISKASETVKRYVS